MDERASSGRLRVMSDEELDREYGAADHDPATRDAILYERLRRLRSTMPRNRANALQWAILIVALIAAVLAGIAAFPVIEGMFEREWFDF